MTPKELTAIKLHHVDGGVSRDEITTLIEEVDSLQKELFALAQGNLEAQHRAAAENQRLRQENQLIRADLHDSLLIIAEKGKYEEMQKEIAMLKADISSNAEVGRLRLVVKKCAEKFREYANMYPEELRNARYVTPTGAEILIAEEAYNENKKLAEMCEEALK
jgi:hypothetical protein